MGISSYIISIYVQCIYIFERYAIGMMLYFDPCTVSIQTFQSLHFRSYSMNVATFMTLV